MFSITFIFDSCHCIYCKYTYGKWQSRSIIPVSRWAKSWYSAGNQCLAHSGKCRKHWSQYIGSVAPLCQQWSYISFALTHCNTLNSLRPSDAYMRRWSNHHWFREWLVAWSAPSHYLNRCWNIVNRTLGNKLQWNLNRNLSIFIQENLFEIVVWKMAAILSRPQWVNSLRHICITNLIIIGSDSGLSPGWCQAIIWTNARIFF